MRINARLDEDRTQKMEYLIRKTGMTISEVIKQAIETYYNSVSSQKTNPVEIFNQSGFIGCSESHEDLSETYKQEFRRGLELKDDPR